MKEIVIKNFDEINLQKQNYLVGLTGIYRNNIRSYEQTPKTDLFGDYLFALQIFRRLKINEKDLNWITLKGVNKLLFKFPIKGFKYLTKQIGFWNLLRIFHYNFRYKEYSDKRIKVKYL